MWEVQSFVNYVYFDRKKESSHYPLNQTKDVTDCCLWCICERFDLTQKKEESKPGFENIIIVNRIVRRKHWSGISLSSHHYGREAEIERERALFWSRWMTTKPHPQIHWWLHGKRDEERKKMLFLLPNREENTNRQCIQTNTKRTHTWILDTEIIVVCLIWTGMTQNRYFYSSPFKLQHVIGDRRT